jgi:hypothetical protein
MKRTSERMLAWVMLLSVAFWGGLYLMAVAKGWIK